MLSNGEIFCFSEIMTKYFTIKTKKLTGRLKNNRILIVI